MQRLTAAELAKIPYLDAAVVGERLILLMPLWDGQRWRQWFDLNNETLQEIQVVDLVRSNYVATSPASETDLFLPFVDFMWQRANWPETGRLILSISDDFHMLGTSAAKLRHFFKAREQIDGSLIASFVRTELEYMLTVSRSVFDLLQEAVANLWNNRVRLFDAQAEAQRRRHKLPPTFSRVVLGSDNKVRSADEIAQRFGLPEALAARYAADAVTFAHLRAWRDRIVHGGSSVDMVFVTERGFGVSPTHPAFSDFQWAETHRYNDNVVSLLPWVANVVGRTIDACTGLLTAFASVVPFPPEVAPGYRIFIRDPVNEELAMLSRAFEGELVWWAEQGDGPV